MGASMQRGGDGGGAGMDRTAGTGGARSHAGSAMGGRRQEGRGRTRDGEGLANALGWFSIGLGIAQLTAPRRVARLIGIEESDRTNTVMRAVGLREITAGVGLLSKQRPTPWAWTRVAGDVMDLTLLSRALTSSSRERDRTASATAAVVGITALDVYCGGRLARGPQIATRGRAAARGAVVTRAITVNRPVEEVYRFWRDFQNLPRFMRHVERVDVIDDRRTHWRARAPGGATVEWDAETVDDRPNELIAWRSLGNADVHNAGSVRFRPAPGGRGTEVIVTMEMAAPGGAVGKTLAKLTRLAPEKMMSDDLLAFKQVMEVGEVVLSDATAVPGPHPAYPPEQQVQQGRSARQEQPARR